MPSSKSSILRLVPALRAELSRADAVRLDKIIALLPAGGTVVLADVLTTLYPGKSRTAAQAALRQFRLALAEAAENAKIRLSLETDGQTRSAPEDRTVWFEGEDRVIEEVKQMVGAEVAGVERSPQYAVEDRPVRLFVSYAHADLREKTDLLARLNPCLRSHSKAQFDVWSDRQLQPGENWFERIKDEMAKCDFGLLLVSPAFLASEFITKEELQYLLASKHVFPVALKRVLFNGTMKLGGLEAKQVFFDERGKAFAGANHGGHPGPFRAGVISADLRAARGGSQCARRSSAEASVRRPPADLCRRV